MLYISGSQQGINLPLEAIWQYLGTLLIVITEGRRDANSTYKQSRSGTLLNILQCTDRPTTKNYPFQNVNSAEIEKPRSTQFLYLRTDTLQDFPFPVSRFPSVKRVGERIMILMIWGARNSFGENYVTFLLFKWV